MGHDLRIVETHFESDIWPRLRAQAALDRSVVHSFPVNLLDTVLHEVNLVASSLPVTDIFSSAVYYIDGEAATSSEWEVRLRNKADASLEVQGNHAGTPVRAIFRPGSGPVFDVDCIADQRLGPTLDEFREQAVRWCEACVSLATQLGASRVELEYLSSPSEACLLWRRPGTTPASMTH